MIPVLLLRANLAEGSFLKHCLVSVGRRGGQLRALMEIFQMCYIILKHSHLKCLRLDYWNACCLGGSSGEDVQCEVVIAEYISGSIHLHQPSILYGFQKLGIRVVLWESG